MSQIVSPVVIQRRTISRPTIVRVDDLEVFDRGLGDTSVKVEHVRLSLFVPARGFVHQGDQFVRVAICMAGQQSLQVLE